MCGVRCSATMSTVIGCVNCQAGRVQIFDRLEISADVFAHAVGDLDHATRWTMTVPTKANHFQSVRARKVELGRRCDSGMSDLSRHRVSPKQSFPSSALKLCRALFEKRSCAFPFVFSSGTESKE